MTLLGMILILVTEVFSLFPLMKSVNNLTDLFKELAYSFIIFLFTFYFICFYLYYLFYSTLSPPHPTQVPKVKLRAVNLDLSCILTRILKP